MSDRDFLHLIEVCDHLTLRPEWGVKKIALFPRDGAASESSLSQLSCLDTADDIARVEAQPYEAGIALMSRTRRCTDLR
jgi:hypothetical protein